jgi:hypothetical protein
MRQGSGGAAHWITGLIMGLTLQIALAAGLYHA